MMPSTPRGSATGPPGLKERGYLLVWFSIIVVVLFAIAGLSYDFGQRYYADTTAQRAADAAALAGVVFRDGTSQGDTNAINAAIKVAAKNGYTNGPGHLADVVVEPILGNQLKVTVHAVADNLFAGGIGVGAQDFWRSSQAAYDVTTPLGSPSNVLGNEPLYGEGTWLAGSGFAPAVNTAGMGTKSLWLDIHGPRTPVHAGDQFDAENCAVRATGDSAPDPCWAGGAGTSDNQYISAPAQQNSTEGHWFTIRNADTTGKPLVVQAYDPAWVPTGSSCRNGGEAGLTLNFVLNSWWLQFNPSYNSWLTRYAMPGSTDVSSPWCSGDDYGPPICVSNCTGAGGGGGYSGSSMQKAVPAVSPEAVGTPAVRPAFVGDGTGTEAGPVTTYTLYQPGTTAENHSVGQQVTGCTGGNPVQYGKFGGDLWSAFVNPYYDSNQTGGSLGHKWEDVFHQWVTLCTVQHAVVGDYLLRVQTDVGAGANPDSPGMGWKYSGANAGWGLNRYSLRAANCLCTTGHGPTTNTGLKVFANSHLNVAANVTSNNSFFLTRVEPAATSRTLDLTFYDPGDLAVCDIIADPNTCHKPDSTLQGTITIGHQPDTGPFQVLSGCTASFPRPPDPAGVTVPPAGSLCTLTNVVSTLTNGRLLKVSIPFHNKDVPGGWNCNKGSMALGVPSIDCWLQVRFAFPTTGNYTGYLNNCGTCAYGTRSGSVLPQDVTTWTARISGSPVRLVEVGG